MFQTLTATSNSTSNEDDQPPPLSSVINNHHDEECSLPDEEVIRTAMRVATSCWSQLQIDSETMSDIDVLKKYIRLCPYVSPDSAAVVAAFDGLDRYYNTKNVAQTSEQKQGKLQQKEDERQHQARNDSAVGRGMDDASNATETTKSTIHQGKRTIGFQAFGHFVRSLFLDFPLIVLLAALVSVRWVHRLNDFYLKPRLDVMVWNPHREEKERTYYPRYCDSNDVTTLNPEDLILSDDATVEDAYQHQLLHGFTVFPKILSDQAATELRNLVISKNQNLTADDSINVINNENRFSFGLGTEEPSVVRVLKELTANRRFVQVMERVLGPNPAMFEMTAITSTYGAVSQYWHMDVYSEKSSVQHSRSFGHAVSVFIPLQNTTAAMGATAVCPGLYMCPRVDTVCEDLGFQMVDTDGLWRAGDALLMNSNSYHRGSGHSDPNGPDRVLFIVSFTPKPIPRAESRQLPHGSTFSIRWDMWGHTLGDLAHADTVMTRPWTILRSFGLYKSRNADWGVDLITSTMMRIANEDVLIDRKDLAKFIERGGFKWLPQFLHGEVDTEKESAYDYVWKTFINVELFVLFLYGCVMAGYMAIASLIIVVSEVNDGAIVLANLIPRFGVVLRRLLIIHLLFYGCYRAANLHVDRTDWAKDIKAGRVYTNPFAGEDEDDAKSLRLYGSLFLKEKRLLEDLKSTFPHRQDVLIEKRYSSRHFGISNDLVNIHPGNRIFKKLVVGSADTFKAYPDMFRDATARFIVSVVSSQQGRFLYQDWEPSWRLLSDDDAIEYSRFRLTIAMKPSIVQKLAKEVDFLISDYKFGVHRHTVLAHKHSLLYLNRLFQLFTGVKDVNREAPTVRYAASNLTFRRTFSLSTPTPAFKYARRPVTLQVGSSPGPPDDAAWLKDEDAVDAMLQLEDGSYCWFEAKILLVTSSGSYHLQFADREISVFKKEFVRPFVPYLGDTTVQVRQEGIWYPGVVVADHGNRNYDVFVEPLNSTLENVHSGLLRRKVLSSL